MLLALELEEGFVSFNGYCERLGLEANSISSEFSPKDIFYSSEELYCSSLSALWLAMHRIPLYMLTVNRGLFAHLGTSSELLEMITCISSVPTASCSDAEGNTCHAPTHDSVHGDSNQASDASKEKLRAFAAKYSLRGELSSVSILDGDQSGATCAPFDVHSVTVNSVIAPSADHSSSCATDAAVGKTCRKQSLIEHR